MSNGLEKYLHNVDAVEMGRILGLEEFVRTWRNKGELVNGYSPLKTRRLGRNGHPSKQFKDVQAVYAIKYEILARSALVATILSFLELNDHVTY